ncbi:MAG: FAD-binding oxidoreductase [Scytonematopsis contorta HA4267-MV1]|jgi:glycolate oxidase FAD binding subunit|nr:FAD-binding oxidoreductase [Scytonematopsis contorta HA4267-MV1]
MKAMSSDKQQDNLAAVLASCVGSENSVSSWNNVEAIQQKRILQAIASQTAPSCIVYPNTQEELAQVMIQADRYQWRILPCGSGTKLTWGGLSQGIDVVVSTERLNKLVEHAVGDLTVTVEAGMKFSQLQSVLAPYKQFLALDPTSAENATIGGIVATADTGSLRQRYGGVRDQLLGLNFVRADGKIAKAGGRVVKNVAGYDLMKLFTGSYGTLSIITQATFRLYPMPEASGTVVLTGTAENVSQASDTLRNSALTPTQADLLSSQLVLALGLGKGVGLIVRFQSINESVKEQSNRLLDVGQKLSLDGLVLSGEDETNLWKRLREQMYFSGSECLINCKIGVVPTNAVDILSRSELGLVHIGSGLGVLGFKGEVEIDKVLQMRRLCESYGGFLSVLQAPSVLKESLDVWGYGGNALDMMRKIKLQFDGRNVLSPGRFLGSI